LGRKAPVVVLLLLTIAPRGEADLSWPPTLTGGKTVVTDTSPAFLKPPATLQEGVEIARTPPTIDFMYYPDQTYLGAPWSNWGDGLAVGDKYYSTIGDHRSPRGAGLLYEYDATSTTLRLLVNLRRFLESSGALAPDENYTPGKIHCRMDMGSDGWLYYGGHRGSPRTTTDQNGFRGDWIFRTNPKTVKTEIVAVHPVPKHVIPMSVLDPRRMIFYGGTAPGKDAVAQDVQFFAYDIEKRKVLLTANGGPERYAIFAKSTGCLYWDGKKYNPQTNKISSSAAPRVRSATQETPQGIVYGTSERNADIWAFDVKTEALTQLGSGAVGSQQYTTTIDADPTGRYLYYVPGAHGGSERDGTAVVQFDVKTKRKKVIAFLYPFYRETYGYTPIGTFGTAVSPKGDRLYVTWNGSRAEPDKKGRFLFDTCALAVIHIPESERMP